MNDLDRIAAHVRKVAANEGGIRCGVCARDVVGLASACCQCEALYHTDCWDYNQGCAVYGCKAAPRDPLRIDLASLKPRPTRSPLLLLVLAAFCLGGVYAFATLRTPAATEPPTTRVTGSFKLRVGAPPAAPGQHLRELHLDTRILVASAAETAFLRLTPGPLPRPIEGAAAWSCLLDAAEKRGTAHTVAAPSLVASENRALIIRIGKSMMFTGNPNATREPNSYELKLNPVAVTDTGVKLEAQGTITEIPYGTPTLVQVVPRAASESAFWARWGLKDTPEQVLAVVVTPNKPTR